MKNLNSVKKLVSALTLTLLLVNSSAQAANVAQTINLTPETIRVQILDHNHSLVEALNQVEIAKQQVNLARTNLLPSLNLGAMLSGTNFLISTIQCLLPFLMPSNWTALSGQKSLFEAQKYSYLILQLNTYSSALAMYYAILSDSKTQAVYQKEASDYASIYKSALIAYSLGAATQQDVLNAKSQAEMASVKASQLLAMSNQETAAMRSALNMPLSTQLKFVDVAMPASAAEGADIQKSVNQANAMAPENQQLDFLIKAAHSQKWSQVFGFVNSTALSNAASSGQGSSSSRFTARGTFSLSFSIFPSIQISNRNIQALELQATDIVLANTRILETSVLNVNEAKKQFDLATQSEKEITSVYRSKLIAYSLGQDTFNSVLLARTQVSASSIARIEAEMNLNLLRVTLHRTLLSGAFGNVSGCREDAELPKGHFFKDMFGGRKAVSLDEVCNGSLATDDENAEE